jgi:hypothetical protein
MKISKILLIPLVGALIIAVPLIFKYKANENRLPVESVPPLQNLVTFSGTIKRFTRPEPDIYYDYQIVLSKPVIDAENASGLNQLVSFYIAVPASDVIKQQLENSVDKNVTVEGQILWGYAESRYLSVTKVTDN